MKESLATLWQRMVYVLAYIGALVLFLIVISVVVAISRSIKRPRSIPLSRQVPAFVVIVTDTSVPPTDIPPTVLSMVTPVSVSATMPAPTRTPVSPTQAPLPTNTPTVTNMPTNTGTATNTPLPTVMPAVTLSPVALYGSGGLGQTRAWWESRFGKSNDDGIGFITYGNYIVSFFSDNAYYIERRWKEPASQQDALTEASLLIPSDQLFVKTYTPDGRLETMVHLHTSKSLRGRFAEDLFTGGASGDFTVQFNIYDGGITRMIIGIGNNP